MEQWDAGRKNKEDPHNVAGSEAPPAEWVCGRYLVFYAVAGTRCGMIFYYF